MNYFGPPTYDNFYNPSFGTYYFTPVTYIPAVFTSGTNHTYYPYPAKSPTGTRAITNKKYTDEKIKLYVDDQDEEDKDKDKEDEAEKYFSDFWDSINITQALDTHPPNEEQLALGVMPQRGFVRHNNVCNDCLQPYYNKKEVDKLEIEFTCVICLSNKKSMLFVECGHFVVCFNCSKQCDKCPICSKVSNIIKVFLS